MDCSGIHLLSLHDILKSLAGYNRLLRIGEEQRDAADFSGTKAFYSINNRKSAFKNNR
jgi:hypothetical protein